MTTTASPSPSPAAIKEQQEWVYIGQRLDDNQKVVHVWLDQEGRERWFSKPLAKLATVGCVYRMTVTGEDGTSIYTGGPDAPVFLRHIRSNASEMDLEQLAIWRADHELTLSQIAGQKAQKKIKEESRSELGTMTLAEAARWYRSSWTGVERAGKLSVLIHYLQSGALPQQEKKNAS